jgi:hypothetical protein
LLVGNQKSYSWLNAVGWIIDWPKLNNYGLMVIDAGWCWLLDDVHPIIIPQSPDKQFWSMLYVLPWYLPDLGGEAGLLWSSWGPRSVQ